MTEIQRIIFEHIESEETLGDKGPDEGSTDMIRELLSKSPGRANEIIIRIIKGRSGRVIKRGGRNRNWVVETRDGKGLFGT